MVAALVAAAEDNFLEEIERDYAYSLADDWNIRIEERTYVEGTELDHSYGLRGHYVRLTPEGKTAMLGRLRYSQSPG